MQGYDDVETSRKGLKKIPIDEIDLCNVLKGWYGADVKKKVKFKKYEKWFDLKDLIDQCESIPIINDYDKMTSWFSKKVLASYLT